MDVRRAEQADAEAMAAVIAEVAPEGTIGAQAPVDLAARAAVFRTLMETAGSAAWVLVDGGDGPDDGPVAGGVWVTERIPGVLTLGMALRPAARGRGGGRALLDAVLGHATAVGAHKVDLEVWTDNARAIALYARAGFVVEGLRDRHYRRADGTLRSTLIMARRTDGDPPAGGPPAPGR